MHQITTEPEYVKELDLIRNEVNTAIECFYTYLEIHRYAAEENGVYRAMNAQAAFWNINLYSLQAAFFLTLGRIFDDGKDTHSVHKLLKATGSHPEFFSKKALSARRWSGGVKPEWLDALLDDAFEPEATDLRVLKKTIVNHRTKYDEIYADIRNLVFAHKINTEPSAVEALFGKTLISELDTMLYALYDVTNVLWHLLHNGCRPELGVQTYDYQERIKKSVRKAINKLLEAQPA